MASPRPSSQITTMIPTGGRKKEKDKDIVKDNFHHQQLLLPYNVETVPL
jgi:hypothetical protein